MLSFRDGYNHSVCGSEECNQLLATLKDKAVGSLDTPGAVLQRLLSTCCVDVQAAFVSNGSGINLSSGFQDGVFKPSDELNSVHCLSGVRGSTRYATGDSAAVWHELLTFGRDRHRSKWRGRFNCRTPP